MTVHEMTEPWFGMLVTQCSDVAEARELVAQEVANYMGGREDADAWFLENPGRIETGRIIPATDPEAEGVSWWWRTGYKPGPGVTTAVLFQRGPRIYPESSDS